MSMSVVPKPYAYTEGDGFFVLPRDGSIMRCVTKKIDERIRGEESYELTVKTEGITLAASTSCGLFRGFQTLKQLVKTSRDGKLACVTVLDRPRFAYRAFMIDSARHMQTIDELKRMIDAAVFFKLNVFHWHLCDDQGFRIESKVFPELNRVGSYRDCDDFGKFHIDKPYGGFYTQEEIGEIVRYCASKYIEVIPEIDMPGHVSALIASYPHLSCEGEKIPVRARNGIFADLLCAGKESTYEFIYALLDEVCALFPSPTVHIGGDEAPKVKWYACPHCTAMMRDMGLKDAEELQGVFTRRICDYLASKGKKAIVWNDSLKSGLLDESVTVQYWMGDKKAAADHANKGGAVINSDFYHYYADYPFGMTPLWKTYRYEPILGGIKKENAEFLKGIEMPIWTEYVRDEQRMHEQCFPRFAAAAETGWTTPENKSYHSFKKRIKDLLPVLSEMGIQSAPPSVWDPLPIESVADITRFFSKAANADSARELAENKAREKVLKQQFIKE